MQASLRCQILAEFTNSTAVWRLVPAGNSSLSATKHFINGLLKEGFGKEGEMAL